MSENYMWNPWHGCKKISEGCLNCYMYEQDKQYGVDSSKVKKCISKFKELTAKNRQHKFKIPSGITVGTCFTSDFFIEEADEFRKEAYSLMELREDLTYFIITKRPERLKECLPPIGNPVRSILQINVTAENQKRADERIPILLKADLSYRGIVIAPILEKVDLRRYLKTGKINCVSAGGESAIKGARNCKYEWILDLRKQCEEYNINFYFYQTGSNFIKDKQLYRVPMNKEKEQALKSGLNYSPIIR